MEGSAAAILVLLPPGIIGTRLSVHGPFDQPEKWSPILTWTVALPHMILVATDFVVERVIDGYSGSSHLVNAKHVKVELIAVGLVIVVLMRYKQKSVYHFV